MEDYTCTICGKKHAVFNYVESPIPDILTDDENQLKDSVVKISDGFFILNKKELIAKGTIHIEKAFEDTIFMLDVYMNIPLETFSSQIDRLKSGEMIKMDGKIASSLPLWKYCKDLEASMTLYPENFVAKIVVTSESLIKLDQNSPISKTRNIQLLQHIYHPDFSFKPRTFDKDFHSRFHEIIEEAKGSYIPLGRYFGIDINARSEGLFQIISSDFLEKPSYRGFGFHLANDDINADYAEIKKKMDPLCNLMGIDRCTIDSIECYQKDYRQEIDSLYTDTLKIVKMVYEVDVESLDIDLFEI